MAGLRFKTIYYEFQPGGNFLCATLRLTGVDSSLPRRVLALGSDYPPNTLLERHSHRRAQFLYAMNGLMKVKRMTPVAGPPFSELLDSNDKTASRLDARRQHPQPVYCCADIARVIASAAVLPGFSADPSSCWPPPASCRCCMKRAGAIPP